MLIGVLLPLQRRLGKIINLKRLGEILPNLFLGDVFGWFNEVGDGAVSICGSLSEGEGGEGSAAAAVVRGEGNEAELYHRKR